MRLPLFSKNRKPLSIHTREAIDGYLMILPSIIYFLVFIAGPMIGAFALSFTQWDALRSPKWIGLGNFVKLAHDELFWKSLYNTAYFTVIAIPLHIATALGSALILNTKTKFIDIYRTLFYVPCIIAPVAIGLIWMWLLYPDFGLINLFLRTVGLQPLKWLFDPALSKPIMIALNTWQFGVSMVIFLAALQDVPVELYEAAEIDGATLKTKITHVTIPCISPVLFYVTILQTINSFQVFTYAFVMTDGGPADSTLFSVLYIWRNAFEYFKMGYASALGVVLFGIIMASTLLQFRLSKLWVHSEASNL